MRRQDGLPTEQQDGLPRALEKLEHALDDQAADGQRQREAFVDFIAHELRRPLGAMLSAAEVLERCAGDEALERDARQVITRQGQLLSHAITDLLEILRVAAGSAILAGGTQEVAGMVEKMRKALAPMERTPPLPAKAKSLSTALPRRRTMLLAGHGQAEVVQLRGMLEPRARQINVVPDGDDALPRLLALDPEVAIVDVDSRVTGPGFARRARAAGYAGKMVALGSKPDPALARTGGFDAMLDKPTTDQALLRAIFDT